PHPSIGHSRRMQVPHPSQQHAVMIEAVENHMPEVIIIDEIGTELEAQAARTIAERGVQLVGTAHGNTLENLILNPTLSDLIGGIQTVTLGDEEARRRHSQKSILERKSPPTFDVVVEIQSFQRVAIHSDVANAVDAILRNRSASREIRWIDDNGELEKEQAQPSFIQRASKNASPTTQETSHDTLKVYPFGINRAKLTQAAKEVNQPLEITDDLNESDMLVTSRNYYRRKPQKIRDAEAEEIPVYVIKSNSVAQIKSLLESTLQQSTGNKHQAPISLALKEAEDAITEVINGKDIVELAPQNAYIRRLQHILTERYNLDSHSNGEGPLRRVSITKTISD
ncbi:MAG: single-stranded DNA-binding protein, partial [Dehalococcoidia bacterium]|nr:single-stranded DNA-binding protein [Dehalococcoidia bacterium]